MSEVDEIDTSVKAADWKDRSAIPDGDAEANEGAIAIGETARQRQAAATSTESALFIRRICSFSGERLTVDNNARLASALVSGQTSVCIQDVSG